MEYDVIACVLGGFRGRVSLGGIDPGGLLTGRSCGLGRLLYDVRVAVGSLMVVMRLEREFVGSPTRVAVGAMLVDPPVFDMQTSQSVTL